MTISVEEIQMVRKLIVGAMSIAVSLSAAAAGLPFGFSSGATAEATVLGSNGVLLGSWRQDDIKNNSTSGSLLPVVGGVVDSIAVNGTARASLITGSVGASAFASSDTAQPTFRDIDHYSSAWISDTLAAGRDGVIYSWLPTDRGSFVLDVNGSLGATGGSPETVARVSVSVSFIRLSETEPPLSLGGVSFTEGVNGAGVSGFFPMNSNPDVFSGLRFTGSLVTSRAVRVEGTAALGGPVVMTVRMNASVELDPAFSGSASASVADTAYFRYSGPAGTETYSGSGVLPGSLPVSSLVPAPSTFLLMLMAGPLLVLRSLRLSKV
jgi:hypothetical protein